MADYLNLSVVTDGFDRDGRADRVVRAAGLQLDYGLGTAHQARHSAAVLKECLLLILQTGRPHHREVYTIPTFNQLPITDLARNYRAA